MATIIDDIEQSISSISPLMKTSEVINIPADEDAFVAAYEANNDDLVVLATELQTFRGQLNTSIGQMNTASNEVESNALIASAVGNYQGAWSNATTYSKSMGVSVGTLYYISKVDNNLNHAVTDTNYWLPNPINDKINKNLSSETEKSTPVDADLIPLSDSAASFGLKKLSWANLKATILNALNGLTEKTTPVDADIILIGDSASSYAGKKVTLSNLKTFVSPSASETVSGIIELATTPETQAGTDDTRAITPLKLKNSVLGLGQTWQDVTASRVAGTTYMNSTGKPIFLAISVINNSATNVTTFLHINNIVVAKTQFVFNGDVITVLTAIVPNGATYKITASALAAIQIWQELR